MEKQKLFKNLLLQILICTIIFAGFPSVAFAEEGDTYEDKYLDFYKNEYSELQVGKVISGERMPGTTYNATTGILKGTPTTTGTYVFTCDKGSQEIWINEGRWVYVNLAWHYEMGHWATGHLYYTFHATVLDSRTETTATPQVSPIGAIEKGDSLSLSCATSGASIYYTLDGSTPNPVISQKYTTSVSITVATTVKAIAVATGYTNSPIATYNCTINSHLLGYNGNGAINGTTPAAVSLEKGATANAADNPYNRFGYAFGGWNTQANGSGKSYAPGEGISMGSSDITLYAQWIGTMISSVSISQSACTVLMGDTTALTASITPENMQLTDLIWSSSNPLIATVNSEGVVTGVSEGAAVITAESKDDPSIKDTCAVTVGRIHPSSITLNYSNRTMEVNSSLNIVATLLPSNTTIKDVEWSSMDQSVADVDANGVVTAYSPGKTIIYATTIDEDLAGDRIPTFCDITVIAAVIPVSGINLNTTSTSMTVNDTQTLTATVLPEDASNKVVTWISSDNNIATVNQSGAVTGISAGAVTISAVAGGISAECSVTVNPLSMEVTGVTLNEHKIILVPGASKTIIATVSPIWLVDKTVAWSSNNPSVATVDSSTGVVTGIAYGLAMITAQAENLTATCTAIVTTTVSAVLGTGSETTAMRGKTVDIPFYLTGVDPTVPIVGIQMQIALDRNLIYGSSNTTDALNPRLITDGAIVPLEDSWRLSGKYIYTDSKMNFVYTNLNHPVITDGLIAKIRVKIIGTVTPGAYSMGFEATPELRSREGQELPAIPTTGVPTTLRVGIPATRIELNKSATTMATGWKANLIATVSPSEASNKTVAWTSSNTSVATVTYGATGCTVTGVNQGTAIITAASAEDPAITASCTVTVKAEAVRVESVGLNTSSTNMLVGGTELLTATINPSNATNCYVNWASSNQSVVTVNNGMLYAVGAGTAIITATTEEGSKNASCYVKVQEQSVAVTGINLNKSETSMTIGKTETLITSINPNNATNQNVIWSSSNESVATVNNGQVLSVGTGIAIITVRSAENPAFTASCAVNVADTNVAVNSISLNKLSTSLLVGGSETLSATITPFDATNQNLIWSSSSDSVIVNGGKIYGVKIGGAVITVTTADGNYKATCSITVVSKTVAVTGVNLNKSASNLTAGETDVLIASINPSNATNQNVIWSSSNPTVATVNAGNVYASGAGVATITVTTVDGSYSKACEFTVTGQVQGSVAVTGVGISSNNITLFTGKSQSLSATVWPENASDKKVRWSSDNTSVATVNSNGLISAISAGTATITVTSSSNPAYTATCTVTVVDAMTLRLNKTIANLAIDSGMTTLTAITNIAGMTNSDFDWASSDPSVASVTSSGELTPQKIGKSTITVSTKDGTLTATCAVTVFMKGDLSGNDGILTVDDLLILDIVLDAGNDYDIDPLIIQIADLNDDGNVDILDRILLAEKVNSKTSM